MIAIDREKLSSARGVLGVEKAAGVVEPDEPITKAAAVTKTSGILSRLGKKGLKLGLLGAGGAGLYHLGKQDAASQQPMQPQVSQGGGDPYSPQERRQFARHGMDPENLRFIQSLSRMRQGMNLESKLLQQALSGKLPADVMGGGGDEESDLESYA